MSTNSVVPIIVAVIGVLGGAWSYLNSLHNERRVDRLERDKADSLAFVRAQEIYESGIQEMMRQLKYLQAEVNEERNISRNLRLRIASLETVIAKMRGELLLAGVTTSKFDKELEEYGSD